MRIAIFCFLISLLTGCGWIDRYVVANATGWSEQCVDGVSYLQFPSGVTVKYQADGTIALCN